MKKELFTKFIFNVRDKYFDTIIAKSKEDAIRIFNDNYTENFTIVSSSEFVYGSDNVKEIWTSELVDNSGIIVTQD